mmetsp:Transcript_24258/g.51539  ORF Transcript_24258/g.51539 Transcript_24258/m.51539 type:complete len:90 (-) Transcript_24258:254-523(-)
MRCVCFRCWPAPTIGKLWAIKETSIEKICRSGTSAPKKNDYRRYEHVKQIQLDLQSHGHGPVVKNQTNFQDQRLKIEEEALKQIIRRLV